MLSIRQVDLASRSQVERFIDFNYQLYRDCPQWVPLFRNDVRLMLNKKKHPFYEHSDGDFFIVERDGKLVGRIAVFVNHSFNEYHNSKKAQFYLFDCENDVEAAKCLFEAAADWARQRGMTELVGPKGLSALDGYGVLADGYEHRQMMTMMNYNYPYYIDLLEKCGFEKENTFVSCYLNINSFKLPEKVYEIYDRLLQRGSFSIKSFKTKRELLQWADRIGQAYNRAFVNNWEYFPLSSNEVKFTAENLLQVAMPQYIKLILKGDEIVGFLFAFPDISAALKRHNGHLNLFTIVDLLLEFKKTKWISLNGVGVLPEYQGRGGNALMYVEMEKTIRDNGFIHAEQTQMADTAVQVRKDMESIGAKIYKAHDIYHKAILG